MLNEEIKDVIAYCSGASITATGVIGTRLLVWPFRDAVLYLDVTQVPQTSPTLVVTVETSPDDSGWFFNSIVVDKERQGVLTRSTAPADEAKITTVTKHITWLFNLSKFVRLNCTTFTGSGSPSSFTVTAWLTLFGNN